MCPAELSSRISTYGAYLLSAGLRHGDRILIGCSLSPASLVVYLGAIYAGLVAVPVEERVLLGSRATLIKVTGAKATWTETQPSDVGSRKEPVLRLEGDLTNEITNFTPAAPRMPSDLAALMATSGSTGVPRFVMVTHGNLIANTEAIIPSQRLAKDERAMLVLPLSYCFGASVAHTHLYQGGGILFDRRFMFPDKVLEACAHFGCTTFAGVPTVYNVLLRRANVRQIALPGVRRFLQAGGALGPERIKEIRKLFPSVDVYVMYGQTEATARISCLEPQRWNEKPGSVGRPLNNLQVSIVDEHGVAVDAGTVGELLVRGPSVCSGYWNDPQESRRVFRNGWLRTGDLVRQDDEGYMWIEGRKESFLKIRGIRISIAEVEERVTAIQGVYECAACAVSHAEAGEALLLFIVPEKGATVVAEELRRLLPAHWILDSIHVIAELPKTSTGKIARSALPSLRQDLHANA